MGGNCNDEVTNYLRAFGYCALRLPRAGIGVLDVYEQGSEGFSRVGNVQEILVPASGVGVPAITRDGTGADLAGKTTSAIKADLGLSILQSALAVVGGGSVSLGASYGDARSISFTFKNVLVDSVTVYGVEGYLGGSVVKDAFRASLSNLEANVCCVVTEVLKAREILVQATGSHGASLKLNADLLQSQVSGNLSVGTDSSFENAVSYVGDTYVPFGVKLYRLFYDQEGRLVARKPEVSHAPLGMLGRKDPAPYKTEDQWFPIANPSAEPTK